MNIINLYYNQYT